MPAQTDELVFAAAEPGQDLIQKEYQEEMLPLASGILTQTITMQL